MLRSKKVVLLGQYRRKKSLSLQRYLTNAFSENYKATLGVVIKKKKVILPTGDTLNMIIWDMEGCTSFTAIRPSYLEGSEGFIYLMNHQHPKIDTSLHTEFEYVAKKYPKAKLLVLRTENDITHPKPVDSVQKIFEEMALALSQL